MIGARFSPLELLRGAAYPLRGLAVLRKHDGLARYWIMPIVLTALALLASFTLTIAYHDDVLRVLWPDPSPDAGRVVRGLHALANAASFAITLALLVLACVLSSTICAAPFNDALSEAVEEREAGKPPLPFALARLWRELMQSVALSVFRLLLYAAIVGPLWLLSWLLPGVGHALYLGIWLMLTAAYFALDYVDWPATRRGFSIRQRFGLLWSHPLRMLGFGFAAWACLFVPVLNLAFMPLSVAGGTLLFLDLEAGTRAASSRTP